MRTLSLILIALVGSASYGEAKERRVETSSETYNKKVRQAQKRKPSVYKPPTFKKTKRARYPGRSR